MPTYRTMLFDHCVITFPVPDDTEREPGIDACPTESLPHRRKLLPAVVAVGLMLLPTESLSSCRNCQLLADRGGSVVRNLPMSRHRRTSAVCGVFPNGVLTSFADELTAVGRQVLQQVPAFHGAAICGTLATRDAAVSSR